MKSLFSKKPSKKNNPLDGESSVEDLQEPDSPSPTKSPTKPPSWSAPKKSQQPAASPPSARESKALPQQQQQRSSRGFARHPTDPGSSSSSSRRKKHDHDTHPLNLPPEERKRFSELSAMSDRNSNAMDIDQEPPSQGAPSSPAPPPQSPSSSSHGTSFTVPIPISNGTNGAAVPAEENGGAPAPPPHTSPPSSPEETAAADAENFKNEGNKYFKAKDYVRAIECYTKAVVLQPDSATFLGNRAAAFMSAGKNKEALEDCKRAVDLDPENPKILLRLARIYTNLGLPEEALATFARIKPAPSVKDMATANEMHHHVLAAQSALNDGTSATMVLHPLDMAERLLGPGALKPRKWQLMRGEALLRMGDVNSLGEAQNISMSLLRNNNQDPEALVLRGRALYAQGENDKAVQHFRKALSCDPDFKNAIKWLRVVQKLDRMKEEGNGDYKAGRWQAAVDKYTAALEVDPANRGTNSKILQNRALCWIKLKKYDDAIADCEKAVALDPSYMKARKTKANALGQAERWEDAVREWKSIEELDPSDNSIKREIRKAELEHKKSLRKDYYKILGIEKTADDNQIKKAYRKLAIVHHPDKNPGDAEAETRFKDISEAYETLSDSQKRARYDSGDDLADMSDMFGGGGGGMGGIDPEILFSMMGQGGGFGGGGGGGGFPGGGFAFNGGRPQQRGGFPSGGFHYS